MFVDLECPECKAVVIDKWVWKRDTPVRCTCGIVMTIRPAAPGFKVTGFNAKNNYGLK